MTGRIKREEPEPYEGAEDPEARPQHLRWRVW